MQLERWYFSTVVGPASSFPVDCVLASAFPPHVLETSNKFANNAEFVGCSPSLSGALRVNPWSVDSIADGIYKALKLSKVDQKLRHGKHWAYVASHTVSHWAAAFTRYLSEVTVDHAIMKTYSLGLGLDTFRMLALDPSFRKLETDVLLAAYKTSTKRLILCDYDGTLVPSNQVCKHHSSGACQVTQGGLL